MLLGLHLYSETALPQRQELFYQYGGWGIYAKPEITKDPLNRYDALRLHFEECCGIWETRSYPCRLLLRASWPGTGLMPGTVMIWKESWLTTMMRRSLPRLSPSGCSVGMARCEGRPLWGNISSVGSRRFRTSAS